MTYLNIQQGQNIEVVSTKLIKKLYEAALSVPEPLEGEQDAAYMSGNLQVDKSYRTYVEYLTNRFDDLHINVTAGYYIPFHDSAVNDVLKNTIGDGIGVLDSQLKAANPNNTVGPSNNTSIVDTREMCLMEGTISGNTFFAYCTNLKIIGIPQNLTRISEGIYKGVSPEKVVVKNLINFLNATKVQSYNRDQGWDLYLTNDGTNIEKIENLIIPNGVTFQNSVQQSPFYHCTSIKNVTVPSGLIALGGFDHSSIESLTFEVNSTLQNIWDACFYQCSNFVFDVANLPQTITTIGSDAFRSCSNVTGALNLPNLTSLGQSAFYAAGITSITDFGSITQIPNNCFQYSALQSITLPSTCTAIKSHGLSYMTTLTTVSGGSGLTTIEGYAFYNDTNLTSVAGLSNVTIIGEAAFQNCPITGTLNLPNLTSLGKMAFFNTGITNIVNLGSLTTLDNYGALASSALQSIVLPASLKKLSMSIFANNTNSINKLIFPHGFKEFLGGFDDQKVNSMVYLQFPSTVTKINCLGMFYFNSADLQPIIVVQSMTPPITGYTENNNSYNNGYRTGDPGRASWYVPDSALVTYQTDPDWMQIANSIYPISRLQTDSPTYWAIYQANKDYGVPTQS